jgi:hypothetical protein
MSSRALVRDRTTLHRVMGRALCDYAGGTWTASSDELHG